MSLNFDLIVIGGGSGGVACARRSTEYGASVALIESDRLGGTCVIRGCVPKKLMMYAGEIGKTLSIASSFGWTNLPTHAIQHDLGKWTKRKNVEIDRLEKIYEKLLTDSNVNIFRGKAHLLDKNSIQVGDKTLTGKKILIASGGRPETSLFPGLEKTLTSDDILNLSDTPKTLGILGSGYIATEFACIMANLGVDVNLFYRAEYPLRNFDQEIRIKMKANLKTLGVKLFPKSNFIEIERKNESFKLHTNHGHHEFNLILNALGRKPNTENLFKSCSPKLGESGEILVDSYSETSIPGVFAVGDVTDRVNLTPVAIAEGRAVAENLFNKKNYKVNHSEVASAVFTSPQIGVVGLTEEEAINCTNNKIRIYESEFNPLKNAFIEKKVKSYFKLLVDDQTEAILGAHIIGDDAAETIQTLAVAFHCGLKKTDFDKTIAVHPTSAEELVLMRKPSRIVQGKKC